MAISSRIITNHLNGTQRNRSNRSLFNILLNGVPSISSRFDSTLRRHQRQTRSVVEKDFDLAYYKLEYHMQKLRDDLHPVCTADYTREKQKI